MHDAIQQHSVVFSNFLEVLPNLVPVRLTRFSIGKEMALIQSPQEASKMLCRHLTSLHWQKRFQSLKQRLQHISKADPSLKFSMMSRTTASPSDPHDMWTVPLTPTKVVAELAGHIMC
jgi:hypothetical protein